MRYGIEFWSSDTNANIIFITQKRAIGVTTFRYKWDTCIRRRKEDICSRKGTQSGKMLKSIPKHEIKDF